MKKVLTAILMATLTLAGCSSFQIATEENTKRSISFAEGFLEQAANDLTTINMCWIAAIKSGTKGDSCTNMAIALRLTNTFLYAFFAKPEQGRVPAAPEEILKSLVEKGMEFSLMKFGFQAVERIVSSGQLAQAQIAQAAINKPTEVIEKPVIVTVPEGSGVLPQ